MFAVLQNDSEAEWDIICAVQINDYQMLLGDCGLICTHHCLQLLCLLLALKKTSYFAMKYIFFLIIMSVLTN